MLKTREEKRQLLIDYDRKHRYRHMLELDERYPEVDMFGPQCISADVGAGWKELLIPCLEVLKAQNCKACQIKQKFGGLRIYWQYPDKIETALEKWHQQPQAQRDTTPAPFLDERAKIDSYVNPVVAEAERLSFRTCEDCGTDLGAAQSPSHKTQCAVCKDRR